MATKTPVESPWLTVAQAANYARRHEGTISAALRNGSLRGNQSMKKGKWLVHRDDLDAWIRGEVADVRPARVTRARRSA